MLPGLTQRLPGLGVVPSSASSTPYFASLSTGTWVCPASGYYLFYGMGGGGSGNTYSNATAGSGGGGGIGRARKYLSAGQTVSVTVGAGGAVPSANNTSGNNGSATTLTFPDGSSMVCGGGTGPASSAAGVGGAVTGADVSAPGLAGSTGTTGVAGGAAGSLSTLSFPSSLGGGGANGTSTSATVAGAPGAAQVTQG